MTNRGKIGKHPNWRRRTPERDEAIWRAILSGLTLAQVGERYGLSRERVRQLYVIHQRRRGLSPRIDRERIAP
jgi:Sigma-70, region 4